MLIKFLKSKNEQFSGREKVPMKLKKAEWDLLKS